MWTALAGGLLTAGMKARENQMKARQQAMQQQLEIAKTRGAPFTGQWGQLVEGPSRMEALGAGIQGAMGGMRFGQQLEQYQDDRGLQKKQQGIMDAREQRQADEYGQMQQIREKALKDPQYLKLLSMGGFGG